MVVTVLMDASYFIGAGVLGYPLVLRAKPIKEIAR
jgi:hypothetical protein